MAMGKQWVGVAVGALVGAGVTVGAVLVATRGGPEEPTGAKRQADRSDLVVAGGTAVELLLLQPLHSGDAEVGDVATVVVTKDVRDTHGAVAIPAGHTAKIEVVRSREASVATSLVNQPARLEVRFLDMGVGGARVPLSAEKGTPKATLELTRATSSRDEASAALKRLWAHPETQRFLSDLADRLNGENTREDFDDPDSKRILADVAGELGLSATKRIGADGLSVGELLDSAKSVGRSGQISVTEVGLALQAITELGHVASSVDRGLRGTFKGRNIKIPIGTKLTAYVSKDAALGR
jgi:hypothetical protein